MRVHVVNVDRKSTRLNSSHTEIYTLSLHDALPISRSPMASASLCAWPSASSKRPTSRLGTNDESACRQCRSEEHTSELQSHRDLHSFPTRRSSDLALPYGVSFFVRLAERFLEKTD